MAGGINQVLPPGYPASASVSLALAIEFDTEDFGVEHQLRITLEAPDRTRLLELGGPLTVQFEGRDQPADTVRTVIPIALDMREAILPGEGVYTVRIGVDRLRPVRLILWARPAFAQDAAPQAG
ncbi:MAG: hypothetical protein M3P14_03340 [Chloroflexota bacterium]|nr:hypothetical protein [Chloroflexota bacterium]